LLAALSGLLVTLRLSPSKLKKFGLFVKSCG